MQINSTLVNKPTTKLSVNSLYTGLLLFSLLFLFLYRETIIYLCENWSQLQNGEYAHGFVVVGIVLYMIWQQRSHLLKVERQPQPLFILIITGFSISWMLGILLGIRVVESMSFYLLLPSMLYALGGRPLLSILWFPLLYLLVAFPVWELFLPYLQSLATRLSYHIIKLAGTNVVREDAYLIVSSGKFLVAEGCSGLRYLLAAMTFSGFYIYLERLTRSRALGFFFIVVFAAILSNTFRISAVVIMGDLTDMQHPWVHDHLMLGWYIFIGMLLPIFWLGGKFCDAENTVKVKQGKQLKDIPTEAGLKANNKQLGISLNKLLLLFTIAIVCGPLLKTALLAKMPSSLSEEFKLVAPTEQAGWQIAEYSDSYVTPIEPNFKGVDAVIDKIYMNAQGQQVRVYVASYAFQKQNKELINVNNFLYNEEYWQSIESRSFVPKGATETIVEITLKNNRGDEKMIWFWYRIAGQTTTKAIITKLLDLYAMVRGKTGSSVLMLTVDLDGNKELARQKLTRFYQDMAEPLNASLDVLKN